MGEASQEQLKSSQRVEPGSFSIKPAPWPKTSAVEDSPETVARQIIDAFSAALDIRDYNAIGKLFREDGYFRDHLVTSWSLRTVHGPGQIEAFLGQTCHLTRVEVDTSTAWRSPTMTGFSPVQDVKGIMFYIKVTTKTGTGRGIVRMIKDDGWKIWTFYTVLESLHGFEEAVGSRRPKGVQHGATVGRKNWSDRRKDEVEFVDQEPYVLIVGAGQAGLTAHARLKMLNVPSLIIDANENIGDNWRRRYHQLVLHDPIWFDHLPYLSFPPTWPVYTPKDKLADFFETYAKTLELNVWTRSELQSATWNDAEKTWDVSVRRRDAGGEEMRTLRPKVIIQATGHSGKMHFPEIPGRDTFEGTLCHSSQFSGATPSKGRKAIVIGACNSSHDICQDLYENGYEVTMVQRSTTCVVSSASAEEILVGKLYSEDGPPIEDSDIWLWGWPSPVYKALHIDLTTLQVKKDAALLEGLAQAGFALDKGPDDGGLMMKYLQRGGGYYFDVGASKLIIDGKIKVKHGQVAEILPRGMRFDDGTEVEADEIIFATGYENMRTSARAIFGDALADKLSDVWGWDEEGEIRGLFRDVGHPGFWYHGGNLAICRYYSRILALQIKARMEGLIE